MPAAPNSPVDYDKEVIMAVRAFAEGKANDGQQKLVWDWLLYVVCGVDGMSFYLGGEDGRRSTDFAEGRRFVGNQLRKMLHPLTLQAWEEAQNKRGAKTKRQEAT